MSVTAIQNNAIDRIISAAFSCDLNAATAVLNQSELTEDQKTKIASILKEPRSDMRQRIVAVFEENITSTAASSQSPSEQQHASFSDAPTSPFGNAYPCTFEFGGNHYQNATACFLAQQYTDQPEIMNLFTNLGSDEATALAELNPMTKERKISWENPHAQHVNKDDVLMNVLRAKFGQNPDLKKQLLETGAAFLVCQGHEFYLSDNFNGTGKNALGTSLMRLRGEYGGTSQVAPPAAYCSATQDLQTRCHFMANELNSDIVGLLFNGYLPQHGFKTVTAVACVNKQWNDGSTNFWAGLDLKQQCPELTILDAKAQGVSCDDEPKISNLQLFKWFKEVSPYVEGNAGVTQLTMTKGTTLNQLVEIAKGEGMAVDVFHERIIAALGDVPVEQTYGILITNNVLLDSRYKAFDLQKILVEGHGCVMPTVQEYVALCVYTNKVFKKCLYGKNFFTEGHTFTVGRSSTYDENYPMIVGLTVPDRLQVWSDSSSYEEESIGAGGQRKF